MSIGIWYYFQRRADLQEQGRGPPMKKTFLGIIFLNAFLHLQLSQDPCGILIHFHRIQIYFHRSLVLFPKAHGLEGKGQRGSHEESPPGNNSFRVFCHFRLKQDFQYLSIHFDRDLLLFPGAWKAQKSPCSHMAVCILYPSSFFKGFHHDASATPSNWHTSGKKKHLF